MLEVWLKPAILAWIALGGLALGVLLVVKAPYGRHARTGWGPSIPNRLGWILMETPSVLVMACLFLMADVRGPCSWIFLGIWQAHYIHRAWVFPFRVRGTPGRMPLFIAVSGLSFNLVNAFINGAWLFLLSNRADPSWLGDPRFISGVVLFGIGFVINLVSDTHLLTLRAENRGYQIPRHPLFRHISCPNYLGEIMEWTGWALATWSLPGLAFAIWTFCNLAPRARSHHRWYQENFSDYPPARKALFPKVF